MRRLPRLWGLLGGLAAATALAVPAAHAQEASTDSRLSRRFAIEVRSAPLGDVTAQLGKALGIEVSVEPALADQRVNLRAGEISVRDFMKATERLLSASWSSTGEGTKTTYRLARQADRQAAADQWLPQRRTQFINRLLEIASAAGRSQFDPYAVSIRQKVVEAHPQLPDAALDALTPDYLRQAQLVNALRGANQAELAKSGFVSLPLRSLSQANQQVVIRFAAGLLAGAKGLLPESVQPSPQAVRAALNTLNQPQARVEYRIIYGDAWSDLMLVIRIGYPDHWASATLSSLIASLPDARALQPQTNWASVGDALAKRISEPLQLNGLNADQAFGTVAQAAKLKIASDAFARPALFRPPVVVESLTGLTVREVLDSLAEAYGYFWWKEGDWVYFRHRFWPEERRVMVADAQLRRWGTVARRLGRLDADALGQLSSLTDEQLMTINMAGLARGGPVAPVTALDLGEIDLLQRALRFARALPPAQVELASSVGLNVTDLSPTQQTDFAALAADYGYPINPAEAASWAVRFVHSYPPGASPTAPLDGILTTRLTFSSGTTRAATLALRLVAPLENSQPPAEGTSPPAGAPAATPISPFAPPTTPR